MKKNMENQMETGLSKEYAFPKLRVPCLGGFLSPYLRNLPFGYLEA